MITIGDKPISSMDSATARLPASTTADNGENKPLLSVHEGISQISSTQALLEHFEQQRQEYLSEGIKTGELDQEFAEDLNVTAAKATEELIADAEEKKKKLAIHEDPDIVMEGDEFLVFAAPLVHRSNSARKRAEAGRYAKDKPSTRPYDPDNALKFDKTELIKLICTSRMGPKMKRQFAQRTLDLEGPRVRVSRKSATAAKALIKEWTQI